MAKKNTWLLVGAGVLVLGLIGSTTDSPSSDVTEPTLSVAPSSLVESIQREVNPPTTTEDESLKQDIAEPTEVVFIESIPPANETTKTDSNLDVVIHQPVQPSNKSTSSQDFSLSAIPEYSGSAYVAVNENVPFFSAEDMTTISFESYSNLDNLGRCGVAYACVGQDIMPTEERGSIGMVRPSGWETIRYDDLIEDRYLYNRCHLLGYQLTGENANEQNLITGTRYMNIQGMLPFENQVAGYVKNTNNHVLLRVTPVFEKENLLASGVLMEAKSVEDDGEGISFCVFTYNVQPGIVIDYATGASSRESSASSSTKSPEVPTTNIQPEQNNNSEKIDNSTAEKQTPSADQQSNASSSATTYIGNKNTKKFHFPSCSSVSNMKESNKVYFDGSREQVIEKGYVPCKRCSP